MKNKRKVIDTVSTVVAVPLTIFSAVIGIGGSAALITHLIDRVRFPATNDQIKLVKTEIPLRINLDEFTKYAAAVNLLDSEQIKTILNNYNIKGDLTPQESKNKSDLESKQMQLFLLKYSLFVPLTIYSITMAIRRKNPLFLLLQSAAPLTLYTETR